MLSKEDERSKKTAQLVVLLDEILPLARFNTFSARLGVQDYRRAYNASRTPEGIRRGLRSMFFTSAEVELGGPAQPLFEQLVEALRAMLEPKIDPGTERIAFVTTLPVPWKWPQPDVRRFARQVIRCAAVATSPRTAELLESRIRGERLFCTRVTVLEGICQQEECLTLGDGIRFERLSKSAEDLVAVIPEMLAYKLVHDPLDITLPGATVLCVDVSTQLQISRPGPSSGPVLDKNLFLDPLLIQALSLACDGAVDPIHSWFRFDRSLCLLTGCVDSFATDEQPLHSRPAYSSSKPVTLTQQHITCARRLYANLRGQSQNAELLIAIERWQSSATRFAVNRAIDVRIALEALFASRGSHAELGHRIALRGAWYLGKDTDARFEYFKTLKSAYDVCSRAVHSGSLDRRDTEVLDTARAVCREALIKRIKEGRRPDDAYWTALVLGRLPGSPVTDSGAVRR